MKTKPTITCPDCGVHIEVDAKLAAAVLARQSRGKPENFSQHELEWRRKRLAVVRMKRWSVRNDNDNNTENTEGQS